MVGLAFLALIAASGDVARADPALPASVGEILLASPASLEGPLEVEGTWRLFLGDASDHVAFASPNFDDSNWEAIRVPGSLGDNGHKDFAGLFWLRVTLRLPATSRELSLRLPPVDTAVEVFIDGKREGGVGRVDAPVEDAHDQMSIWPISVDTAADGRVVLALRCLRTEERASSTPSRGGIVVGPIWIGSTADVVHAQDMRDVDKIICGFVVLIVALYHLHLFRRRRQELHYFWFGMFCICMGGFLLFSSEQSLALFGTLWNARLFWLSLLGTFPTFLQFIFPLLGRRIHPFWRANQVAMLVFGIVAALWPSGWFANKFIGWVELFLILPVVLWIVVGVVRSAWRGNEEARTLLLGTVALALAAVDNVVLDRTTLPLPQVTSYAMALFVFSIASALASRFARLYRELDEKNRLKNEVKLLNAQVQGNVKARSDELSSALSKLANQTARGEDRLVNQGNIIDGRYVIDQLLGAGGMGAVYSGRDTRSGNKVAIKVIKASSLGELEALHRFLREARAVVSIDHPAIVRMLHVDISSDGFFYQAQELIDGITLDQRLKSGPVDAARVARTGSILADALAAAHSARVIHRDVKPSNIMLTSTPPGVKLLDFGVAKLIGTDDHTGTGRHIGTPAYMAPEQRFVSADEVSEKIDVYSLGLVLYQMALGGLPGRVLNEETDAELGSLIARCLAENPGGRPSAKELSNDLAAVAKRLGASEELSWEEASPSGITDILLGLLRTP